MMARQRTNAFRVYDRDIPELPFAVDWYAGALHIAEYARPHDRDESEHDVWVDRMAGAAAEALGVDAGDVFVKKRARQRGASQYQRVAEAGAWRTVEENGIRFQVNLSDYVDTGLFLDHRPLRHDVFRASKGKAVLNLFGYTGAFSVHAAAGGATRVTTVDLSRNYLSWARDNMTLNELDPQQHGWVEADVMAWVREASRGRPSWDLAIVDPPTFSNSRRTKEDFDVQANHAELLACVRALVRPGGTIWFSTNFRRFRFEVESLPGARIEEISEKTIPPDYRNRRIHRVWRIDVDERGGPARGAAADR